MRPETKRVSDLLEIGESESDEILREMSRFCASLDALSPDEFASAATRAATRIIGRSPVDPAMPRALSLPDRADGLARLIDALLAIGTHFSRRSDSDRLATESEPFVKEVGRETIMLRRGRALVPSRDSEGRTSYRAMRYRDLDLEEFTDTEKRVIDAMSDALYGRELGIEAKADLVNAITIDTDATEREAISLVESLGSVGEIDPPSTILEFAELIGHLLRNWRAGFQRSQSRPGRSIDRTIEAEAGRLRRVPPETIEVIVSILETAPLAPLDALAELAEPEALIVSRLALVGLEATRSAGKV